MAPTLPDLTAPIWWAALLTLCGILLLPFCLVDVPPLLDYPNHLARLFLLTHGATDENLTRFYVTHWAIIPDLGIDLAGQILLPWVPVHVAGRIIAGTVLLLPVLGTLAYGRAALGRRSGWMLGGALVAYHQTFLQGFLNFNAGMGLALILAAVWLRWRDMAPQRVILATTVGVVGLFFCHLMGVIFFALLIGAHELAWAWMVRAHGWRGIARRFIVSAVPFIGVLVLYGFSPLSGEAGQLRYPTVADKLARITAPWVNYDFWLDAVTASLCLAIIVGLMWRERATISLRSGLTLGFVGMFYIVSPAEFAGVANVDLRFVILFGFLLFCIWAPASVPLWVATSMGGLFLLRMALLGALWHGHGSVLADIRQVISEVPLGSRVLSIVQPTAELAARRLSNGIQTDTHIPALLVVERRSWWPYLFDNVSQQPIATRSPYHELALRVERIKIPLDICDLTDIDFLFLLGKPAGMPDNLERVAVSNAAALYRVHHASACVEQIEGMPISWGNGKLSQVRR